jgi:ribosome-associated translation inhibitor RaiA
MKSPVQITFRNMQRSVALEARVRAETGKLDRYYPRITSCRVVVEAPHRHHTRGELFHVRIEIHVPAGEIVVRHEPTMRRVLAHSGVAHWSKKFENHVPHKDVYVTVRDAFKAARRQLEEHARRLRGDVKGHDRVTPLRKEKLPRS